MSGKNGENIAAHCPFHSDRHPSFSVHAQLGIWFCWSCTRSGTLRDLLEAVGGFEGSAAEILREVRHRAVQQRTEASRVEEDRRSPQPMYLLALYESFTVPPAWALHERRLTAECCERFGIRWDKGWVIPVRDPETNSLWGWQFKRADLVRNYPRGIAKSKALFGWELIEPEMTVVLVESPLDAVRLAVVDVPAVASFGAYVSNMQIGLLIEKANRIVLALDNDREGKIQNERLYPRLARLMPTVIAQYPPTRKDPGNMSDRQCREVFADVKAKGSHAGASAERQHTTPAWRPTVDVVSTL
jgi:DNA primase